MTYMPAWAITTAGAPADGPIPLYVNGMNIASTQWDFTLDFQLTSPAPDNAPDNPHLMARKVVQVIISPTQAKAIAHVLATAIEGWEAKFAPLPSVEQLISGAGASPLMAPPHEEAAGEPLEESSEPHGDGDA